MNPSYDNLSNNSGASNFNPGSNSPSFQTGQGDIILTNSVPKKANKRIIIIVAVVLFVLLIIGIIILIQYRSNNNISVEQAVNQYTNLLSYGKTEQNASIPTFLSITDLTNSEDENIYNIPKYSDPLSDNNIAYYNSLQNKLEQIITGAKTENLSDQLGLLAESSKAPLSYYFVSSALAYSNAGYDYFTKNKNLDGFLSEYGLPFNYDAEDPLSDYVLAINNSLNIKTEMYNEIAETSCLIDDEIDYACLNEVDSNSIISNQTSNILQNEVLGNYSNNLLNILIANANEMINLVGEQQ